METSLTNFPRSKTGSWAIIMTQFVKHLTGSQVTDNYKMMSSTYTDPGIFGVSTCCSVEL